MSNSLPTPYGTRITRLREALQELNVDCLVVSSRENVRYLIGFTGSSGWVLVSPSDVTLATDSRYIERARHDLGEDVAHLTSDLRSFVASYASSHAVGTLGFEADHLPFSVATALQDQVADVAACCEVWPTEGVVENLRMVKDADEIAAMEKAAELSDGAIAHARSILRRGMTEGELAWEVERWMREHGSGSMPFDVIVAFGPDASLPHATPGNRRLAEGEPIVIDLGARWEGYCSDLTRTLFLGYMAPPFDAVYGTVLAAHMAALSGARCGMRGAEVDELARATIRAAGLADSFTHGLGHGVGLEVHEKPAINSRSNDVICDGVVFTIEPGVYLPGQGGVRIEDTVVMRDGKPQSFSRSDKEGPIITVHAGPRGA